VCNRWRTSKPSCSGAYTRAILSRSFNAFAVNELSIALSWCIRLTLKL
jgi:hypothetical protein